MNIPNLSPEERARILGDPMPEVGGQKAEVSKKWKPLAFEDLFYCRSCRRTVQIRGPGGGSAFMALRFVAETLNNLCPACLAREKRN